MVAHICLHDLLFQLPDVKTVWFATLTLITVIESSNIMIAVSGNGLQLRPYMI